jgi:filamentous hemagglutinin family protein
VKVVSHRKHHLLSGVAFAALSLPAFAQTSPVLPGGGQVTAGQAAISVPASNTLIINQSSQAAILGWQSFSIGQGGTVQFNNGTGATLNRVTGNVPSKIDGLLSATGSVYLVNPAGVVVGSGGRVATGGSFIASTQDVSDTEFMAGKSMTLRGTSEAGVVNYGRIGSLGGDVALIAREVENHGSITAPNGTAVLAAGYEVLMRDAALSDGKFMVKVGGGDTVAKTTGSIKAAEIELRANGGNVYALAGNTGSITKATGVASKGGRVFLTAGDGAVTVLQKIVARKAARTASGKRVGDGGEIDVLGGTITLKGALLDVSGATAGGTIRVGGDWQGRGDLPHAQSVTVDSASVLRADATLKGDGGTVTVWSDGTAVVAGLITARGGRDGGKGGVIETSGRTLDIGGVRVDASAPAGSAGQWLIDPEDLTVNAAAASAIASALDSGTDTLLQTTATSASGPGAVTPGGAGDITVAAPITWASNAKLTLDAYHSIAIDAPMTIAGAGGLDLRTNNGGSGGTLTFKGGVQFTGAPNSGQSLTVNGNAYTLLYSMADLQGINTDARLSGNYALAKSLDATGVTGWRPLGTDGAGVVLNGTLGFSGSFTGLGNTISNLTVDIGSYNFAGLFGYASGAISDIGLIDVLVKGRDYVGGLVGVQLGNITQAYATGDVTGNGQVGGLVGYQSSGTIAQAYATVAVTGSRQFGGLGGGQISNITQASATAAV